MASVITPPQQRTPTPAATVASVTAPKAKQPAPLRSDRFAFNFWLAAVGVLAAMMLLDMLKGAFGR